MSNQETIDGANIVVELLYSISKKLNKNVEGYLWQPYHPEKKKDPIIVDEYVLKTVIDGEEKNILFDRNRLDDTSTHKAVREQTERYIEEALSK